MIEQHTVIVQWECAHKNEANVSLVCQFSPNSGWSVRKEEKKNNVPKLCSVVPSEAAFYNERRERENWGSGQLG